MSPSKSRLPEGRRAIARGSEAVAKGRGGGRPARNTSSGAPGSATRPRPSFFEVGANAFTPLVGADAVAAFERLLQAEAFRLGVAQGAITINATVDVPDGGVDASVESELPFAPGALIAGETAYQLKGGSGFKPWQRSALQQELCPRARVPSREALKPAIRRCLDAGGRYVVVCLGHDLTPRRRTDAEGHLTELLGASGYEQPRVEVWGAGQLAGFARPYPAICLGLTGRSDLGLESIEDWARHADMQTSFLPSDEQQRLMDDLVRLLEGGARHVRVVGEPGLGKTRTVLEALRRAPALAGQVLYAEHAEELRAGAFLRDHLRADVELRAILVVDDCDEAELATIWNRLRAHTDRIRLVTMCHDPDRGHDPATHRLDMPRLPKAQIEAILGEYGARDAYRWAELCDGTPRVAHVIGENLRSHPEDVLAPPTHTNVWERFVVGTDDPESELARRRWLILKFVALFHRFGYTGHGEVERAALVRLVAAADPAITDAAFAEVVEGLRRRRVLQGKSTLRIVPRALHVWLWRAWWEDYASTFSADAFLRLPGALPAWFADMWRYGGSAPAAQARARELLSDGRVLGEETLRAGDRVHLFSALAEACPEAAMAFLERTVGRWNEGAIRAFGPGRRQVVFTLEKLVMIRSLFLPAARLLLLLARNESETCDNNASGVFTGLFSLAYGHVAPTEAPPEERLPLLRELLGSSCPVDQDLGLRACQVALNHRGGSRILGAEWRGLSRSEPWTPATYGELYDAYRAVWELLRSAWRGYVGEPRAQAAKVLVDAGAAFLGSFLGASVLEMFEELALDDANQRAIVEVALDVLESSIDARRRLAAPDDASDRARLRALHDRIVGTSLRERVHRHVGWNLGVDELRDPAWWEDGSPTRALLAELATDCLADRQLLNGLIPWLVTKAAERAMVFGIELGRLPGGLDLLEPTILAQEVTTERPSLCFLAGLFRAQYERDVPGWESALDGLRESPARQAWIPELIRRSGRLGDRAARLVLELIRSGGVCVTSLGHWGWASEQVQSLPWAAFEGWLVALLEAEESGAPAISVRLYSIRFGLRQGGRRGDQADGAESLPSELTRRVLAHAIPSAEARGALTDLDWVDLAAAQRKHFPDDALDLFALLCKRELGNDPCQTASSAVTEVLRGTLRSMPAPAWQRLVPFLGDPTTGNALLRRVAGAEPDLLDRDPGLLHLIPRGDLWRWVDEAPAERATLLTNLVHKSLSGEPGALTRELLVRYARHERVARELHCRFSSMGCVGSWSVRYRGELERVTGWRDAESDPIVRRWLDERLDHLNDDLSRAIAQEEREG